MEIAIILYTIWAIYAGYKFISGRSEWLDKRAALNIACKCILSVIVGYFIAAFYLFYLMLKFFKFMSEML